MVHPVPAQGFMMYPDRRRTLASDVGAREARSSPPPPRPLDFWPKRTSRAFMAATCALVTRSSLTMTSKSNRPSASRAASAARTARWPSAHPAGAAIDNFSEFIDFYRPDVKSDLYDRVARNAAAALDDYGFDYIYPDGTGENLGFWPDQPEWYAYNLLISKLFRYTKRELMWGHVPITDYSWHIFSRGNTTDYVTSGVIQHFDRVSVAGAADSMAELQPFEFGWFGFFTHSLGSRHAPAGNGVCLVEGARLRRSHVAGNQQEGLDANGRTREIFALIKKWEDWKLRTRSPRTSASS